MNLTSIHEDVLVWFLFSLSGLKIWCCHELRCGLQMRLRSCMAVAVAGSCSSDSTPPLGTSVSCRCGPKKAANKQANGKQRRKKKSFQATLLFSLASLIISFAREMQFTYTGLFLWLYNFFCDSVIWSVSPGWMGFKFIIRNKQGFQGTHGGKW